VRSGNPILFVSRSERVPLPGIILALDSHVPRPSSCPVDQGLRSRISLRITRVIRIALARPVKTEPELACYGLQLVCGAVRRFRENCFLLFEGMHGLVFRRSIHYWQDQPGNPTRLAPVPRPSPGYQSNPIKVVRCLDRAPSVPSKPAIVTAFQRPCFPSVCSSDPRVSSVLVASSLRFPNPPFDLGSNIGFAGSRGSVGVLASLGWLASAPLGPLVLARSSLAGSVGRSSLASSVPRLSSVPRRPRYPLASRTRGPRSPPITADLGPPVSQQELLVPVQASLGSTLSVPRASPWSLFPPSDPVDRCTCRKIPMTRPVKGRARFQSNTGRFNSWVACIASSVLPQPPSLTFAQAVARASRGLVFRPPLDGFPAVPWSS
jgi:hypothetical protein